MSTFNTFFGNAKFTKPLMRQLMAVLQRDMQASLDFVTGTPGSLPKPLEWNFADYPAEQWPYLHIYPTLIKFARPDTVQSRYAEVSIEIVVGVSNQDLNLLAEQVQDYVRAVDGIIASLGAQVNENFFPSFEDFYTALPVTVPFPQAPSRSVINVATTTPMQRGCVLECIPTGHSYGDMERKDIQNIVMRGKLGLLVRMEESN